MRRASTSSAAGALRLGDRSTGRDNNLNLIRMLAACAVLVSHAYPIALGGGTPEPLLASTGKSLGSLAVMVFFAISGFLITASFERRRSHGQFVRARLLRLVPGLFVSVLLVAYLLGPLVTTLPPGRYLALPDPALFVLRNSTIFAPVYTLPGVFADNPYPSVEGSIWTLRYEVFCYAGVFLIGVAGLLRTKPGASAVLAVFLLLWLPVRMEALPLPFILERSFLVGLPFALGAGAYIWRDRVPLGLPGLALTVLAALALRPVGGAAYELALTVALTHVTFWLAYVPRGPLLLYNRLGDYSYGIYIYAFPLQGWAVWAFGPQTPLTNIALSLPPTLLLAILSWHLVEAPAMRFKGRPPDRRQLPGGT